MYTYVWFHLKTIEKNLNDYTCVTNKKMGEKHTSIIFKFEILKYFEQIHFYCKEKRERKIKYFIL